jgi:molybdate transport system substrate-binding protein
VADDVYVYVGKLNDANAMAIVTREGVVLVDTGNNTTDTREILRNIQSVTTAPVRYVVVTQNHTDHSGGAPLFSPPATVIVHERVVKEWAAMKPYQIASWRKRFFERADALKNVNPIDTVMSFNDRMTLRLGGKEIQLIYVDDTYNPGDVAVWLPKEGVLHASMAGYKDRHPDIRPDYSHGTTAGILKQLQSYIALEPKVVVPAHGPIGGVEELSTMVEYLQLARRKVRTLMDQGLSLPQIEAQFDMKEFADWDRTEHLAWEADTIYRELKGLGPQVIPIAERRVTGVVSKAVQDGRFVTVAASDGKDVLLRITGDANVEGIADRTEIKTGMKISALYEVPEGIVAALGYDALEVTLAPAAAGELTILTNQGATPGVKELAAAFERMSGHKVTVTQVEGDALERMLNGGVADLVTGNPETIEPLVKSGKVVASTVTPFVLAGLGLSVRAGAPKPDISTVDKYKAALLAAKSIGYSRGCSGTHTEEGIAQLGLTDRLKAKTVRTAGGPVTDYLARGDFEIGIQQTNIMAGVPGTDYVGPLPGFLNNPCPSSVALVASSKDPESARAMIKFMISAEAAPLLRKTYVEPAKP